MNSFNRKGIIVLLVIIIYINTVFGATKTFQANETDLIRLKPSAVDLDNDTILYFFSNPFNRIGEWQTTYDDAGDYTIDITASDGVNETVERVQLIVEENNRLPKIVVQPVIVRESETVALNISAVDPDNDVILYQFKEPLNEQGQWQTTYDDAGTYFLSITATDGKATIDVLASITILNIDREPTFNLPKTVAVQENEELLIYLNVSDPDGDDVAIKLNNTPKGVELEGTTLSWRPGFDTIKRNEGILPTFLNALRLEHFFLRRQNIPFTFTACANELCSTETLNVVVYNVNRPPTVKTIDTLTFTETEEVRIIPNATDADGDIIHYSFSAPLQGIKGSWKTKHGDRGEHTAYITATDGHTESTIPITLHILPQNRPPEVIVDDNEMTVEEGQKIYFTVSAVDPDNDTTTISAEIIPDGSSFRDGVFRWKVPYSAITNKSKSDEKVQRIEFTAFDGEYHLAYPVTITVKNVNQPPMLLDFLPEKKVTAEVDKPFIFHVAAKDDDNDKLTYEWKFSLHEPTVVGTDTIERIFTSTGKKTITVIISDGQENVKKQWDVTVVKGKELPPKPIALDAIDVYVVGE